MFSLSHPVKGGAFTRLLVLLAAVGASGITASLGFWQLDRARQKDQLQAAIQARSVMPPLRTAELQGPEQHHRVAQVTGRWKPETLVYLENRPMNGQAGFVVLSALDLGDGRAVLVQRGWQPRDLRDRTLTQPVPTPADQAVRVHARVAPPPSRLMDFDGAPQGTVRQNVDLKSYADEFGLALMPISLVQLEPALQCGEAEPMNATPSESRAGDACARVLEDGLKRDWVVVGSSSDKNRGYALQWFGLSALVAGLYLWFQCLVPWRHRRAEREGMRPTEGPAPHQP
jgi:surfeit locus 1 family protein